MKPGTGRKCVVALLVTALLVPPNAVAAAITWTGSVSNSYNDPANWNCPTCGVPAYPNNSLTQSFDASIGASGQTYTTNVNTSATINSLTTGANAQVTILGGNTLTLGTGSLGTVLSNGGVLNINSSGQINLVDASAALNTGSISISGTLGISGAASLTGGGALSLNGGLISGTINDSLTSDNAITGNGNISGLTFQNNGTLTAQGGHLSVSTLADFDGQNLNNNGTFVTGSGANLQIGNASAGSGAAILTNNANIALNGSGLITDAVNKDILSGFLTTNNGTLTLGAGATTTLSAGGGFANSGVIAINDGTSLTFSAAGGQSITNSGTIQLNSAGKATTLTFDSAGTPGTFTLTGTGTLTLSDNANNFITGKTGGETLLNDVNHTIQGAGTIANSLAAFTNNGTLSATSTAGNALIVAATLTNWDGANLNGGIYSAAGTLQLNSLGSNPIAGLANNANVTINGAAGLLTGNGTTNALGVLSSITDSSLTIASATTTIAPNGGTLAVFNDGNVLNTPSSLNVLAGGSLTIAGSLTNTVGDFGFPGSIMVSGGSTLVVNGSLSQTTSPLASGQASVTLDGSTMSVGGSFTQDVASALTLSGSSLLQAAGLSNNGGTITVNDTSVADFRGGAFTNLTGGTLTGGTYNITGTLNYAGGAISTLSGASVQLNNGGQMLYGTAGAPALSSLTNLTDSNLSLYSSSTLTSLSPGGSLLTINAVNNNSALLIDGTNLTINGGMSLTSAGPNTPSASVTVENASTLTATGAYSQTSNTMTNVSGGSTLLAAGLSNQGVMNVNDTSVADFRGGSFQNLSGGTLTGGSYNITGTFNYSGGAIQTLNQANVSLTGGGQILYGTAGTQAFGNLTNIVDSAFTLNGSSLTAIKPNGGTLAVSSDVQNTIGQTSSLTLNGGTLTVAGNVTNTNGGAASTISVLGGAVLNTGAFTQTGGDTLVGSSTFQGAIPASSGTLNAGGMFSQSAGAMLQVENGGLVTASGLTNNASQIYVDGTSKADFRGGTFTNLSGGTLTGGSYKVAGQLLYTGGGITTIAGGTSVDLVGTGALEYGSGTGTNGLNNVLLNNAGSLTLEQSASLNSGGVFNNQGGLLTVESKSTLGVTGSFDNGSSTAGNVLLSGGGKLTVSGTFDNGQAGSVLNVGRTTDPVSTTAANGGNTFTSNGLTNNGVLVVGHGSTANIEGGAFTNLSANGTLTGGTYAIDGTFLYTGSGIQSVAAGTTLSLDARALHGAGVDASIAGTGDAAGHDAIYGLQDVAGTLALSGGQTETVANGAADLTVDASGALLIGAGFNPLNAYTGGGGNGTLTVDSSLVDNGDTSVGNTAQAAIGTLNVDGDLLQNGEMTMDGTVTVAGNYAEGANGVLTYDMDAASFVNDRFTVAGSAALNGTLEINFVQGFLPNLTTGPFTVLTFATESGGFSNLEYSIGGVLQGTFNSNNGSSFGNGLTFKEITTATSIQLEVVQATPEPSASMLLVTGIIALAAFEHRRRSRTLPRIQ